MGAVADTAEIRLDVTDLPPKNRVRGFRAPARHRIRRAALQASESRREVRLTGTTTASGLCEFVAKDPIDFAGGDTNLYAYVMNDPVNDIDPTGEMPWGLILAGLDLGIQLYQNGGNLSCVNWVDIGLSMVGGGLLNGVMKGAFRFKTIGRHTWGATRSWMNRQGIQLLGKGQQRHHWLFERNQGIGKYISDAIKNQPWNTNPISAGFNNWLSRHPGLSWLGGPSWAGEVGVGSALAAGGANE